MLAKMGAWIVRQDPTLVPLELEQGVGLPPTSDEKWGG